MFTKGEPPSPDEMYPEPTPSFVFFFDEMERKEIGFLHGASTLSAPNAYACFQEQLILDSFFSLSASWNLRWRDLLASSCTG